MRVPAAAKSLPSAPSRSAPTPGTPFTSPQEMLCAGARTGDAANAAARTNARIDKKFTGSEVFENVIGFRRHEVQPRPDAVLAPGIEERLELAVLLHELVDERDGVRKM